MSWQFSVLAFLFGISAFAQEKQKILYDIVELDDKVNSHYHDSAPVVSADGKVLYFFIADHPENQMGRDNTQDIWFTQLDGNGEWTEAVHMGHPLNSHRFNQVLNVLDNGHTLLLRGGHSKKTPRLSMSHRGGGKWSSPEDIDIEGYVDMNKGRFSGGVMTGDQKVLILYFSQRSDHVVSDIFVSFRRGPKSYTRPKKIPEPISTYKDEFGPFLTVDNQTMYFASDRQGGMGGADIWKSKRLDDTWMNWSEPVNLGPPVNTSGFDAYFSVDAEGKAFTTRAFMSADGGHMDILGLIPKPIIVLSGVVRNRETDETLVADFDYKVEGKDQGFITTDEEGNYKVELHEKGIYHFSGYLEGFLDLSDSLDLSTIEGSAEVKKDLYLDPQKVEIVVFGLVWDLEGENPITTSIHFAREGTAPISAESNPEEGYYTTSLPELGLYRVNVNVAGFLPFTDTILIETDEYYMEIEENINLIQPITLSGYVMNDLTQEPLAVEVKYELNGSQLGVFKSEPSEGYYSVILPEPGKYVLRAGTEGYLNLTDSIEFSEFDSRSQNKDLLLIPIEIGVTVRLNNIFFDFDKTTLRPESFPELDRVVELLKQNPTVEIEIRGHTDDRGSDDYNLTLSQGRADEVRNYLIKQGLKDFRVEAKGYGETVPEVPNNSDDNRQVNRRVEFKVTKK